MSHGELLFAISLPYKEYRQSDIIQTNLFAFLLRWQHEIEYRMVRPFTDKPDYHPLKNTPHRDDAVYLFNFELDCIESITFGACMSTENKKVIMSSCEGKKIKFAQAYISRDEKDTKGFSGKVYIIPKDIIPIDNWPRLLEMLPFNSFFQKSDMEHHENIKKINSLSELPYYRGLEEWINEFYNIKKAKRAKKN